MKLRKILDMSYKEFMERLTDEDIENIEWIFKESSSSNIYSDAQGIYDDGARLGCNNLDDEYLDISEYFRLVREEREIWGNQKEIFQIIIKKVRNVIAEIDKTRKIICTELNDLTEEELSRMYSDLMNTREKFLSTSFYSSTLEELEQERFQLQEQLLNVRILLKEKRQLDCTAEIKLMQHLFS